MDTDGGDHMAGDGAEVVLDVVDLLIVLINDLVSIKDHVTSKQSRQTCGKTNTKESVEGLELIMITIAENKLIQSLTFVNSIKVESRPNHW